MKKIEITEVAPRDGWQNVQDPIPLSTKLSLIDSMFAAGIQRMQAGSFVSPRAVPQMQSTAEVVQPLLPKYPDKSIFALVPNLRGAKAAVACGLSEISLVVSASKSHNRANLNATIEETLQQLAEIRDTFPDITLGLDIATAFSCPFEGETTLESLLYVLDQAADIGVAYFDLADTAGTAYPSQVRRFVKAIQQKFPHIPLEVHIHDTCNMGMLSTFAAIEAGVTRVQSALGGLGGCPFAPGASGNVSTEDLVYLLNREGYDTGIDFDKLLLVAKNMRSIVNGNYSGHHVQIM